ncbi:MAG: response regulator [Gemmatimonadota bacterium]
MSFRTVTIEDDRRYRRSLGDLLAETHDFRLVDSFGTAEAALRRAGARTDPEGSVTPDDAEWDLVLMDLELPGMDGIEATSALKEVRPETTVVVLTVFDDAATVLEAICAGADGYLAKRLPPEEILRELRAVMGGGSPLSPGIARTVLHLVRRLAGDGRGRARGPGPADFDLTEREEEVLACLVEGLSYGEAGEELGISLNTVRSHVRSIYAKLQVDNVAEAVGRALREDLV